MPRSANSLRQHGKPGWGTIFEGLLSAGFALRTREIPNPLDGLVW